MDVLMPQLGETVAEGKITQWYKAPGDRGAARRQPVRDRDRQDLHGGAGHRRRRAGRGPGRGRRRGAGRRGRGRHLGWRGAVAGAPALPRRRGSAAASARCAGQPRAARMALQPSCMGVSPGLRRGAGSDPGRSSSTRSSRCARRAATTARPGAAASPSRRWRAGWRPRAASTSTPSAAPARTGASSLAISPGHAATAAPGGGPAGASRRSRSRRSTSPAATRRWRSTTCAPPSPRGWSRPSRRSRTSI